MRQWNLIARRSFILSVVVFISVCTHNSVAQSRAYVPNAGSSSVSVVDTGTNAVVGTVQVGFGPVSAAVTPNGASAYVANSSAGTVSVIDTSTNTVVKTIAVGKSPVSVAITSDGSAAYVANAASNSVSVIDIASNAVVNTIVVGSNPVRVTLGGGRAYVANAGSKSVSVINIATKTVAATIPVGFIPTSVELNSGSSSGGGGGGGSTPPQPLEALPVTIDTIEAAVDLLTASGDAATPVNCLGSTLINCPGGAPANPPAKVQIFRSAVQVVPDPLPATTYSFTATISAASLTDIPVVIPVAGSCGISYNTAPSTINVVGTMQFASHAIGDPINEVDLSGLQITGFTAADVSLNGGFGCSIANLGTGFYLDLLEQTLLDRMPGSKICGVVGPALFQQCPP